MAEEKKTTVSCQCDPKDIDENKVLAAIGYVGILFLIPLLAKKDSPYAQFHAKQGMALFVLMIVAQLGWIVFWIPFLGWLAAFAVYMFIVVLFIMGLANALSGKCVELPLIGRWFRTIKI